MIRSQFVIRIKEDLNPKLKKGVKRILIQFLLQGRKKQGWFDSGEIILSLKFHFFLPIPDLNDFK